MPSPASGGRARSPSSQDVLRPLPRALEPDRADVDDAFLGSDVVEHPMGSGSAREHGTGRPEARSMRATVWRQCANRRWPLASARPWAAGGTSGVWHRARNSARSDMARRASTPPRTAARSFTYRSNVATRRCSVSASNTWGHAPAEPIRLGRGLERRRHLLAQGEVLAQTVGDALRKRDLPGCRLELEPPVMLRREIGVHLAADIHGRLRKLRSCARAGLGDPF